MNANDFLLLTRGPLFDIALVIFLLGVILRLLETVGLGRRPNLAEARGNEFSHGMKTILYRMNPDREKLTRSPVVTVGGYLFHIGFFLCLLFFVPHIELLTRTIGLKWPGLPTPVIDAAAVVTMLMLVLLFVNRLTHPVLRLISTFEDYLLLAVTLAVILTGYLAYHRILEPYPLALGVHIFSVEVMMIIFPFTKFMHAFTAVLARYYNGAMSGRRGVQS